MGGGIYRGRYESLLRGSGRLVLGRMWLLIRECRDGVQVLFANKRRCSLFLLNEGGESNSKETRRFRIVDSRRYWQLESGKKHVERFEACF